MFAFLDVVSDAGSTAFKHGVETSWRKMPDRAGGQPAGLSRGQPTAQI